MARMLTWNEIRTRAAQFAARWKDATQENAESQTFWNEFLRVYGVDRVRVATFEKKVKGLPKRSGRGRVDLLWPGLFMAEHKSAGRDLDEATLQALDYVAALPEHERPQWVAASDFGRMRLMEVATGEADEFELAALPDNVERFAFLIGRQLRRQQQSDPVNLNAARQMGKLHDLLAAAGYRGHALELLLVRVLFLLFGDDTGLWDERGLFYDVLADHTRPDGDDLGATLARVFQVLDTPRDDPMRDGLPDWLKGFPYVNGELFSEDIRLANFTAEMRQMLLNASALDWGQVSPAIFGNMFQAAMHPELRADLGAHYTSEENILKVLKPLFLDALHRQRNEARGDARRLQTFLDLLPRLRFFDPACGSGNFLLVTYRELRRLELDALAELLAIEGRSAGGQGLLDIRFRLKVSVEQFFGVEFEEFAAQTARVALWLADHQMNVEASRRLGQNYVNLPLKQSAHILKGDALAADWAAHLRLDEDAPELAALYIVGNPPFTGSHLLSNAQRAQVVAEFQGAAGAGQLDYVAAWFMRAARLMNWTRSRWPGLSVATSLVATNSVAQGQQVAPLWGAVLRDQRMTITAAHQSFKWTNDAPKVAQVICIIVQLQPTDQAGSGTRRLFTYANIRAQPVETDARHINGYLADGPDVVVSRRRLPLVPSMPKMTYGNKPVDGTRKQFKKTGEGNLIISTQAELDALLQAEPAAEKFVKPLLGAEDVLDGTQRWVLWLPGIEPHELAKLPKVRERVARVKAVREASTDAGANRLAQRPTEFRDTLLPERYLVVPIHTSENRDYVPMLYLDSGTVVNNSVFMLPDADPYTFGLLQSAAHMAWLHAIGGRIKSDYRYASDVVYNTMPWPDRSSLKPAKVKAVEEAAAAVLAAREAHPGSTLAQMYDPLGMPADLRAAHNKLDRAVDALFKFPANPTEGQRLAVLLRLYMEALPTLASRAAKPKATRKRETKAAPEA